MAATDMAAYMRNRRRTRRDKLIEMSGGCCAHCGSTERLEFNHIDRDSKKFVLSGDHLDTSWETILLEWEKTELVCKDCHGIHTAELYSTGQIKSWNKNTAPYEHGSMRMYQEEACRCPSCKEAKRQYRMKLVKYSDTV